MKKLYFKPFKNKVTEAKAQNEIDLSAKPVANNGPVERPTVVKNDKNGELADIPKVKGQPIENYDERMAGDVLESMHDVAAHSAGNAKGDGIDVRVGPIKFQYFSYPDENGVSDVHWFAIARGDKSYVVYTIGNEVFYRPGKEFDNIFDAILKHIPDFTVTRFKRDFRNPEEPLNGVNIRRREDCLFIVDSIFGSLTGKSYNNIPVSVNDSVTENLKIIRHNKLSTDGDIRKSIKAHDAKYGSKEDNDFKQELEDEQKKGEVVGCLDQQPQEESLKLIKNKNTEEVNETPVLPNRARYSSVDEMNESWRPPKNRLKKSEIDGQEWNGENYIWEPGDYVIFRAEATDASGATGWFEFGGQVTDVRGTENDSQIVTIMCAGKTIVVEPRDIRPDYKYIVQRNRFRYCVDPRLASREGMGVNPETRLTDKVENDKTDYTKDYADLNARFIFGHIVKDGQRMTMEPVRISLEDISESRKVVRMVNEDNLLTEVPIEQVQVDEPNWTWAVIVMSQDDMTGDDEPLRKIKVDPVSFVEADPENGLVDVLLNGEKTKMMKKHIRILS